MIEFSFLRQRGIELMQQLCGETWTDYNLHDPGVTILEVLCYMITDLSYRTEFPMADLLADKDGKINLQQNAFFIPEDVLTSNPVTVNDFRKFILDKMDCLHNVWMEPFMSGFSYGTMHGLYTMKVQVKKEFSDKLRTDAPSPEASEWAWDLQRQVRACFVSGRNLCEDLIKNITVLKPLPIRIRAEVVITGDQPEQLLADIYRDLEAAINPPVKYYTEQELLDKGLSVEDIHAGPLLKKGFIPDAELPPRKQFLDPAELMKVISLVPGVSYVRDLSIITPEGSTSRAPYVLAEESYLYFEEGLAASPIRLLRDKYEVRIRASVFDDIWPRVKEAARRSSEPVVDPHAASHTRQGQYRDVLFYHSLQHLFPVVYGIGANGLGRNPSPARIASARQLKAYLLFFEQVLANYLAQLANVSGFFSFDVPPPGPAAPPVPPQTYFTQPLYQVPGIRRLLQAFTRSADPADEKAWDDFTKDNHNAYIQSLSEGSETDEEYCKRKNAVLDHLLARFNEQPSPYPVRLYAHLYRTPDRQKRQDEIIEWKAGLLKNMAGTGYGRVRGGDYLEKDGDDKGGFYKKMADLLYIRPSSISTPGAPPPPAALTDAVLKMMTLSHGEEKEEAAAIPAAGDHQQKQEWTTFAGEATMRQRVPASPPQVQPAAPPNAGDSWNFSNRKMSFFLHGLSAGNYTIGPDPHGGSEWLILFSEPADNSWQIISRHQDEKGAITSLKNLIARLRQINILSEGFYLVEHVLLRPAIDSDSFGFRFCATKKDILFQQARWTGFMERERILTDILAAAATAPLPSGAPDAGVTEWAVKALGGRCRVQLQRHKELGFFSDPADLEKWIWDEAAPDIEHIRQQLLLFGENKLRFYPRFEMLIRGKDESMIREEFFNFNMTVLLPAWPARFQDPGFRTFVMDLFRIHTPAHIRLYFQWLNISAMKEFEDLYPNWSAAMKEQDDPGPRKQWSDRIIHFLKKGVY